MHPRHWQRHLSSHNPAHRHVQLQTRLHYLSLVQYIRQFGASITRTMAVREALLCERMGENATLILTETVLSLANSTACRVVTPKHLLSPLLEAHALAQMFSVAKE